MSKEDDMDTEYWLLIQQCASRYINHLYQVQNTRPALVDLIIKTMLHDRDGGSLQDVLLVWEKWIDDPLLIRRQTGRLWMDSLDTRVELANLMYDTISMNNTGRVFFWEDQADLVEERWEDVLIAHFQYLQRNVIREWRRRTSEPQAFFLLLVLLLPST